MGGTIFSISKIVVLSSKIQKKKKTNYIIISSFSPIFSEYACESYIYRLWEKKEKEKKESAYHVVKQYC